MRKKVIAYYSGWGMIYVTDFFADPDGCCKVEWYKGACGSTKTAVCKVTKTGRAYFVANGHRIHLDRLIPNTPLSRG